MPKNIQKSVHDYLSRIKSTRSPIRLPSRILRSCTYPRTPSFSIDDKRKNRALDSAVNNEKKKNDDEATLADIDRFLFENFRSLYLADDEEIHNNNNNKRVSEEEEESHGKSPKQSPTSFDDPFGEDPPKDLCGNRRFFVTRGFSGSLMDSTTTEGRSSSSGSTTATRNDDESCLKEKQTASFPDNCVAVLASSESPYEEFKRSMESVVEERLRNDEKVDWDFMEELLSCFMNMNEKRSHKFILAAFVDVTALMRRSPVTSPTKARSVRTVRMGSGIRKKTKDVTLEFDES